MYRFFSESPTTVSLIGATGKVGRQLLANLYPLLCGRVDIRLFGSENERSFNQRKGLSEDLQHAFPNSPYRVKPAKSYDELIGSDIIAVTAGRWPSLKEKLRMKQQDPSGRYIQSIVNGPLIQEIGARIGKFAPDSTVVVATNQVDMMTHVMREAVPERTTVLGVGGWLDSNRFKISLSRTLSSFGYDIEVFDIEAFMIGFHNSSMFPLESSLKIQSRPIREWATLNGIENEILDFMILTAIEETRSAGALVSKLQKKEDPSIDTGSSVAPGRMMAETISALVPGSNPIVAPCNVKINSREIAELYGIDLGTELSIPIEISSSQFIPITLYTPSELEKMALCEATLEMRHSYDQLYDQLVKGEILGVNQAKSCFRK